MPGLNNPSTDTLIAARIVHQSHHKPTTSTRKQRTGQKHQPWHSKTYPQSKCTDRRQPKTTTTTKASAIQAHPQSTQPATQAWTTAPTSWTKPTTNPHTPATSPPTPQSPTKTLTKTALFSITINFQGRQRRRWKRKIPARAHHTLHNQTQTHTQPPLRQAWAYRHNPDQFPGTTRTSEDRRVVEKERRRMSMSTMSRVNRDMVSIQGCRCGSRGRMRERSGGLGRGRGF